MANSQTPTQPLTLFLSGPHPAQKDGEENMKSKNKRTHKGKERILQLLSWAKNGFDLGNLTSFKTFNY